jgi:ADP-ribosylation factor GTPase-activating protein 1
MPSVSSGGGNGRSASPFGSAGGANGGGGGGGNEDFFARMGEANAQRKEGLPPSQGTSSASVSFPRVRLIIALPWTGGKYTGFGSTPDPPASSQSSSHPSFALSSHAAPSLSEFQTAPLSALTKSWGLFSSAVSSAGKEIHSSVIQPGVARAGQTLAGEGDGGYEARELAARVAEQAKATTGWLSSMAGEGWTNLNQLANQHTAGGSGGGLDFTERLGQMGLGPTGSSIAQDHQQGGKYDRVSGHGDGWNDDGFTDDWDAPKAQPQKAASAPAPKAGGKGKQAEPEWDDEWKEF